MTLDKIVATITIEDVQTLHGVRKPGPCDAQRDFNLAFVAKSHEHLLTPVEMTFYENLAEYFTSAVPAGQPDPYVANNIGPQPRDSSARAQPGAAISSPGCPNAQRPFFVFCRPSLGSCHVALVNRIHQSEGANNDELHPSKPDLEDETI